MIVALGIGTKTFVVLMCISFLFSIAPNPAALYPDDWGSTLEKQANGEDPALAGTSSGYGYGTIWNTIASVASGHTGVLAAIQNSFMLLIVSGVLGIAAASLVFPNQFAIFAGITGFLLTLVSFPVTLFNTEAAEIPLELRIFLVAIFSFLIIISSISFFRGSDW